MGAEVEEGTTMLPWSRRRRSSNTRILGTYNDHRMAMCFTGRTVRYASYDPATLNVPQKTFPDYFEQLARMSTPA
ncbi:hypothetical protein KCP74_21650 [Salmonella enterica subsp. enterica]|nr:hypothetical protein KCP74_21650 [Salmonella enterica subsp. enterica]